MNNEIKELLDRAKKLKYKCDCCEEIAPGKYIMRNDKQTDNLIEAVYIIDKLLDYITNLQEKVNQYENPDDLTLFYMWLDEKAKDKMKKLQEENKRLVELCDKYEEEHKTTFKMWEKDLKNFEHEKNRELKEENERLCNILDNIGYQIEGIIRTTEEFGISKNTGEVLSKHNIELLKNILKMINTKDVSILGSDKE